MLSAFKGLRLPEAVQGTIQPGYSAALLFLRSAFLPMSDRQQLEVPGCSHSIPSLHQIPSQFAPNKGPLLLNFGVFSS
jgi:hypothetical protein